MKVIFDPTKDAANVEKHGLSFADFSEFDAEPFIEVDLGRDYGELRFRGFGRIGGVGHSIAFTRTVEGIRLISFRRAHEKEMRRYE
ncbi:BrnT family toxin [Sphingomonas sp. BIUV-7]|uniref:BrnT family toxin n=1 Tax=Sphingomonas natans TaxID=3063330 RepID=A0ABT8Y8K0_9SPHN|nr:BrnT family toxin [Sphingomonas sp. BIUV-7]MDO6414648.1 BrnT family toxin [Sphingomonas sp. BIUV-7]